MKGARELQWSKMDISTFLLWTLRILLPIVLFCVYFKLQAPRGKEEGHASGLTGNVHSRATLLRCRQAAVACAPVPSSMQNIALKDAQEAPHLFAGGRGSRTGRRDRDERGATGHREKAKEAEPSQIQAQAQEEADIVSEPPEDPAAKALEERMHLESLVNYVIFNRPEQQRVFLPFQNGAPPPPPPPAKQQQDVSDEAVAEAAQAASDKANLEAQVVLRGALGIKRSDVAQHLHECLSKASIDVSELTFTRMIEVCVAAGDLKRASQFLMKMESVGHLPDSGLLDRVMNLYSETRTARETADLAKAEAPAPVIALELCEAVVAGEDPAARTQLSAQAAAFVPFTTQLPQDETVPEYSAASPEPALGEGSAETAAAPESRDSATKESLSPAKDALLTTRTKLTATSAAFEPQFNMMFVPGSSGFPGWPGPEILPASGIGGLPPGPLNRFDASKGSSFEMSKGSGFGMSKGSGFAKGTGFEMGKGSGFEKGSEKGQKGNDRAFWEKGKHEKGFWEQGFEKGHETGQKGKGFEKGKHGKNWDESNGHEHSNSWHESNSHERGKGWGETKQYSVYSSDLTWADSYWTSDNEWKSDDKRWSSASPETSWDVGKWKEKDSSQKKVWKEKPKDADTELDETNGREGGRASTSAKMWKPKVASSPEGESVGKTEVDSTAPTC